MKVLVAHSGTQHSMRVAQALYNAGHDVTYVTTVYNKKKSLTRLVSKLLTGDSRKRAEARNVSYFPEENIVQVCEIFALVMLLIKRIRIARKLYYFMEDSMRTRFGRRIVRFCRDYEAVVMFDTQAYYAFNLLRKQEPKCIRIIDYSAAFSNYSLDFYKTVFKLFPKYKDSLYKERSFLWNKKILTKFYNEAFLSDHIVTASTFVKKSIMSYGISEEKISVIPYGSNIELCRHVYSPSSTLRVLYVGNVTVMKGIPFVFEALKRCPTLDVVVTFVGEASNDIVQMANGDDRCKFVGRIPHSSVKSYLKEADLFLFPSLSDGFGFAPLEAMNYGVPCAVSDNAGISDLITKENGFVIHHSNSEDIANVLLWCVSHRTELYEMRAAAYKTAESCTWDCYQNGWANVMNSLH